MGGSSEFSVSHVSGLLEFQPIPVGTSPPRFGAASPADAHHSHQFLIWFSARSHPSAQQ